MRPRLPQPAVRWLPPLLADLVCVVVFAFGGKASHEANDSSWVVLAIVWPYALAAVVAHSWLVSRRRPTRRIWPEGTVILAVTYVLGMILRAASGRGIAVDFLAVALLFLALTLLGWRAVASLAARRR